MQDETMEEFRDRITRYYNPDFEEAFGGIKTDFLTATQETRRGWLMSWDRALAQETRITKDHADWLQKRRELGDLDALLTRAGR